ncbi:MAG: response regulator, partial [Clostridiales bacterium]|jgi:signal transduction histidine kinase/ActR/RegA family two-component response regulator|nr:response regulator [Clostridiales bacterium]
MEQDGTVEKTFEVTVGERKYWFMLRSSLMRLRRVSRFIEWIDVTPIMEAKNDAELTARSKSEFLASVSHEIRTPMNAIIGMTELMRAEPLPASQEVRADSILTAAMSLLDIINDILDFSKLDAKKMEIIAEPFDFQSFINDTVNMINIKACAAGLAFVVILEKDIPPMINTDELRLKQALVNLLTNAVKFTREGCVTLRVRRGSDDAPTGRGGTAAENVKLFFEVSDTGIGIRREDRDKLFTEFLQLDSHKNRDIAGTGLGLAISHRLVGLMGGEISVESEYGVGSTFSFYITCAGAHTGSLVRLREQDAFSVLCYEPNPNNARALGEMLRNLGIPHKVCTGAVELSALLGTGSYTHVFFDGSGREAVLSHGGRGGGWWGGSGRSGLGRNGRRDDGGGRGDGDGDKDDRDNRRDGTRFVLLKEVLDRNDADFPDAISRPVLTTTLVNILCGRKDMNARFRSTDDAAAQAFHTERVRILVVDDNAVNLSVAVGLLKRYAIEPETANGGREAVKKAACTEYDIIFMDHMMPDMDGLDATRAIRELGGPFAEVTIVALTANAVSGMREQFLDAGMDDFLAKPILIKELHEILRRYLPPDKIVNGRMG